MFTYAKQLENKGFNSMKREEIDEMEDLRQARTVLLAQL